MALRLYCVIYCGIVAKRPARSTRVTSPHKIRMKIGNDEFEAEGSEQVVTQLFDSWKDLLSARTASSKGRVPDPPFVSRLSHVVDEVRTKNGITATWDIFDCNDKKKLVTLQVHPSGETRDADAVLLALYGFKQVFQMEEVKVGRLKESLALSGLRPDRIDRTAAGYVQTGLLLKTGRGPGGRYRLTNTGYERADLLAKSLFEKLL
jgi:hypothetical protein